MKDYAPLSQCAFHSPDTSIPATRIKVALGFDMDRKEKRGNEKKALQVTPHAIKPIK
jgi:hypothetical protein